MERSRSARGEFWNRCVTGCWAASAVLGVKRWRGWLRRGGAGARIAASEVSVAGGAMVGGVGSGWHGMGVSKRPSASAARLPRAVLRGEPGAEGVAGRMRGGRGGLRGVRAPRCCWTMSADPGITRDECLITRTGRWHPSSARFTPPCHCCLPSSPAAATAAATRRCHPPRPPRRTSRSPMHPVENWQR